MLWGALPPAAVVAVADSWSKVNTGTYLGTIGFAYLCFVMFLLFFFALVVFQGAVNEELGLRKQLGGVKGELLVKPLACSDSADSSYHVHGHMCPAWGDVQNQSSAWTSAHKPVLVRGRHAGIAHVRQEA